MKPEQLMEAMEDISPAYIAEAKPRTCAKPEQAEAVQEAASAPKRKEPFMKQTIFRRIMTGTAAAAAIGVCAGGGIFIAKQQHDLRNPGNESSIHAQAKPNIFGGIGPLSIGLLLESNYPLLMDNTQYYAVSMVNTFSWNREGDAVCLDFNMPNAKAELFVPGRLLYFYPETGRITETDSYGNEVDFLQISQYWNYSDPNAEEMKALNPSDGAKLTLTNIYRTGTVEDSSRNENAELYTIFGRVYNPDTGEMQPYCISAEMEWNGSEWICWDLNLSDPNFILACDPELNPYVQPAEELNGFYAWTADSVVFVRADFDSRIDDGWMSNMTLIPTGEDISPKCWHVDGDTLYYLNADGAYCSYQFDRSTSVSVDYTDRLGGEAFGFIDGGKTVIADPAPFSWCYFSCDPVTYEPKIFAPMLSENALVRANLDLTDREVLYTFGTADEFSEEDVQNLMFTNPGRSLFCREFWVFAGPSTDYGMELNLRTRAVRRLKNPEPEEPSLTPETDPPVTSASVFEEHKTTGTTTNDFSRDQNRFGGTGQLIGSTTKTGLFCASDKSRLYYGRFILDSTTGQISELDWDGGRLLSTDGEIYCAQGSQISRLDALGNPEPFCTVNLPLTDAEGPVCTRITDYRSVRRMMEGGYLMFVCIAETETGEQMQAAFWTDENGKFLGTGEICPLQDAPEYQEGWNGIYGLHWYVTADGIDPILQLEGIPGTRDTVLLNRAGFTNGAWEVLGLGEVYWIESTGSAYRINAADVQDPDQQLQKELFNQSSGIAVTTTGKVFGITNGGKPMVCLTEGGAAEPVDIPQGYTCSSMDSFDHTVLMELHSESGGAHGFWLWETKYDKKMFVSENAADSFDEGFLD